MPMSLDDFPEEVHPLIMQCVGLREQNAKLFERLEQVGGGADIGPARVEHIMRFLVAAGVITETQLWEESIAWEKVLRDQLKYATDQIEAMRHAEFQESERQRRLAKLMP